MNGRPRRNVRPWWQRTALTTALVTMGSLLTGTGGVAIALDDGRGRPELPAAERAHPGTAAPVKPRPAQPRTPNRAPRAAWPKPGAAVVTLQDAADDTARSARLTARPPVKAEGLPLTLTGTGTEITARVVDRTQALAAGVDGLVVTLRRNNPAAGTAAQPVGTQIDYAGFADAYGGGYASRLTLVELPACALTTPTKTECRTQKPVETVNDTETATLTAPTVRVGSAQATVLAAVADDKAVSGSYQATSLTPSATWQTNLNTGDFSWSYPIALPEVPGGLKPALGLGYSSASIDGRTTETNNQSSWAGAGFDLWPGYIERRYKPCADDGVKNADGKEPGDLCWAYDNAFISFNGKGGELVPIGNDEFKLRTDDGTRIKRLTSADRANGDDDNEYWELTDPDGVRYYFGYHRLDGWSTGKRTTNSTWTAPVYGDDTNEPCHASTFETSWCEQAWRWNLDYVIDPRGSAIAYYYTQEKNSYGRNLKAVDDTRYTRGGHLEDIEYGLPSATPYAAKALAKVTFTSGERCLPDSRTTCNSISTDAAYWHDTPWDLNCDAGTDCDQGRLTPSFWTRKRLTGITTQVLNGTGYTNVDSWKLNHRWGTADVNYQLLLDSVQHTGHTGPTTTPAITLPSTTFGYTQLANRLDSTGDGYAPFIKERLSTIVDEYGGQTDVNYSAAACDADGLPTPQSNTTRCFPQYLGGSPTEDPELHWFNKYVVDAVTTTDRTGGAPDQVTRYTYLGPAAWHYDDDDGLTKEKHKTWAQWRGYGQVRVKTGGQGGDAAMKSQSDSYFLRGMDGDRAGPSGGTKSVTVALPTGEGAAITDHEAFAGTLYKTVGYSGNVGKALTKSVSRPWRHETAKKTRSWGTITANITGITHTKSWTSLDDGAGADWRTTSVTTTYDTVAGRVTKIDDTGDDSTPADDQCTVTTYATNTAKNILKLPSRVETVAKGCGEPVDRAKDVISDIRTAYDGGTYGAAPTKGDVTVTALLKSHDGTTARYLESGATFDGYGRALTSTDLTADVTVTGAGTPVRTPRTDGRTTTTSRTPATGFVTKTVATTPPAKAGDATTALVNTITHDPLRGLPLTQTDANGKVTTFTYDALGRSSKIWLADRATTLAPSYEFTYLIEENKPVAVVTKGIGPGGGQIAMYTLYDGYLRKRQTQEPGPQSGRLITDTFYDERGLPTKSFDTYYTEGTPEPKVFQPTDALSVETQTRTTYDGVGRPVSTEHIAGNGDGGASLGTTQTLYGGDRTTVIPPEGGTATTTLTDARGRTTELRQHHTRSATASYDTTHYAYTPRGELATLTDEAGNEWTYTYDLLGRLTATTDPDKGSGTRRYDDRGQLVTTTDDGPVDLHHIYDGLGRRTELRENSATGTLRAKWVYDTISGAKGHAAESTRYVGTNAYTSKVVAYDRLYRVTRSSVTIPANEDDALDGTYTSTTSYNGDGTLSAAGLPAAGSQPAMALAFTYEAQTLRPVAVSGSQGLAATTSYSLTGKPLQHELSQNAGKKIWATNTYEWGTQRLATARVDRQDVPGVDRHDTYRYDQSGNILAVSDVSRSGTDNQCFTYDHLRRLTKAWTQPVPTCAAEPSGGIVGGPAPYWHSYTYDVTGNRTGETVHDITGNAAKNTVRTYTYPDPGSPRPHAVTAIGQIGPGGTAQDTYSYNALGNTERRSVAGTTQRLDWDPEGRLAKVTKPVAGAADDITEYLYDADGNRLIARTSKETTLYLGSSRVTLPKGATTAKATRIADLGGGHQAVIEDDGSVSFTIADHLGTGELSIKATNQQLTQRRSLPFGGVRGTAPSNWPGAQGFVGGEDDSTSTGLQHLGAREYDPALGRFVSVDPLLAPTDPQSLNGYAYANNSPLTFSDPDGLRCIHGAPGGGADGICAGVPGDKDGVVNGTSNNCPTSFTSCNQTAAAMAEEAKKSGTYGRKPIVIVAKNDSVTIQGVYIPTQAELAEVFPYYSERLSYDQNVQSWARATHCTGVEKAGSDFCQAFAKLGQFGATDSPGPLELLGVDDYVGCYQGKSGACKAAAIDASISVGTGMLGKGVKVVGKAIKAGLKKGDATPIRCLVSQARHSFTPDTQVLMADGTSKAIEYVEIGDLIVVTDPHTGQTTTRKVVATIVTEDDKHFVDLTLSIGGSFTGEVLTSTTTHPFWSPSQDRWIEAGALTPGATLRTADGGTARVEKAQAYDKRQRTYDLTVNEVHTYYVIAGIASVLVHNSDCPPAGSSSAGSTGRTSAGGVNERQAMDLAREYPEYGNRLPLTMNDPRWPAADGWVKMEQTVKGVEVHYVYNTRTMQSDDFKFKDWSDN
ncbi:polymorphic toxin-type HINT domain-containing protein [Streptomyces sp. NBC_00094]|uniref:polymorphic toxin-type HINT domain-containing protein n=1 Tax=Streptomyces sp. NBC_00094 TaxID=2903620 RepID=UPI00224DA488|nr:polymorphic toxin-type HINT domain-containing protein [Streptomyces sp. NBC_00094]MCX5395344.1 polymorphic toxin-type HINT domain-containing protein [Streptomyces sp. NBC_00094]